MQSVSFRMLRSRLWCLFVVLLPMVAEGAVGHYASLDSVPVSAYVPSSFYSTSVRIVTERSRGLVTSSAILPTQNACVAFNATASSVCLSEIGATTPNGNAAPGQQQDGPRGPRRVSPGDNIGDPGALPVGDVPLGVLAIAAALYAFRIVFRKRRITHQD